MARTKQYHTPRMKVNTLIDEKMYRVAEDHLWQLSEKGIKTMTDYIALLVKEDLINRGLWSAEPEPPKKRRKR